jgi:uncharacterized Tic20 family protein
MEPLKIYEMGRAVLPQPEEISSKDREHAAGAYIMMFASQYLPLPFVNLIASFIYYMFCRKRSRFVAFHAFQSLISQIPTSLMLWGIAVWVIVGLVKSTSNNCSEMFNAGFWIAVSAVVLWSIVYVILSLIAFVKVGKGKMYYLPIFGRIAFDRYFGKNAIQYPDQQESPHVNKPPSGL